MQLLPDRTPMGPQVMSELCDINLGQVASCEDHIIMIWSSHLAYQHLAMQSLNLPHSRRKPSTASAEKNSATERAKFFTHE